MGADRIGKLRPLADEDVLRRMAHQDVCWASVLIGAKRLSCMTERWTQEGGINRN